MPEFDEAQAREAFERRVGNTDPKRILFKRGGSVFAEDVPEAEYVDGTMQRRWIEWQAAWRAALEAAPGVGAAPNAVDGGM